MKKHKVVFNANGEYLKHERDDHFLFKKDMSITINAHVLNHDDCTAVVIKIPHRNVSIRATKEHIKLYAKYYETVKSFYSETSPSSKMEPKYHMPLREWTVLSGDKDWVKKVEQEYLKPLTT